MTRKRMILLACTTVIILLLAACTTRESPTPTTAPPTLMPPTPEPAATTAVPTTTTIPTTPGVCDVVAQSDVTLYQRPSTESGIFGTLGSGEIIQPTMQSADGWLGFVPAVAQAANVGVFRFRWLPPDADVNQSGDCSTLPVAPVLSPTACYFMAFEETALLVEPDPPAAVAATIPAEGYAAVNGQTGNGWYELDLQDSSIQQPGTAWLDPDLGNFNGTCEIVFE
jgi:hypothetical protein